MKRDVTIIKIRVTLMPKKLFSAAHHKFAVNNAFDSDEFAG